MKAGIRHQRPATGQTLKRRPLSGVSFVVAVGSIVTMGFAFPETAFAGGNDPIPTITVKIYNYSQAAPAILTRAEREAGRILGAAGLRAVWLDCPVGPLTPDPLGPCEKAPEGTDLRLRVLGAPLTNQFRDTVFGFAVHPVLASVYYEYAVRRARRCRFRGSNNLGLCHRPRTRAPAAWHEQPFRRGHYAASVGV